MMYSAKEVVLAKIETWKECQIQLNFQYSPEDTLSYIKECCDNYDLNMDAVKEIFDECEEACYYDIENDDVNWRDDEDEDEDEE